MPEPRRERPKQAAREVRPTAASALARDAQTRNAPVNVAAPIGVLGVAALQRQAGNRAATRLLSGSRGQKVALQRAAACPAPPVAPEAVVPTDDHRFAAVTGAVGKIAASQQAHPPAGAKVAEAQQAAVPPANEAAAQAAASQVGKMNEAEAGAFDKAAFIAAVAKAIDAASPKNLDEADKLKDSGKAADVRQQVSGLVTKGKDDSAQDIKSATEAPPDTSAANQKQVTPMPAENAGRPPAPPAADGAVPAPRGPDQTNLGYGPCGLDGKMADAKVTDEQLARGNESQFNQALDAKQKVRQNAAIAPGPVRAAESEQLAAAQAGATATVAGGVAGMHAARGAALGGVGGHKSDAKSADEAKRAEISKHIEDVFTATKTDVTKMLDGLDADVGKAFDEGEKAARDAFNTNVGKEMDEWKDQRYAGVSGAAQWVADKFTGAPPEVDQIFARNRARYLADMRQVISTVADLVGATLTKAKQRIADGQAEVKAYVASQPSALRQFAAEAGSKIAGQFTSLRNDVAARQDAVVGDLAQKYVAARKSVDDAITKMQEENKGLVQEAESAVEGAIDTIEKLRDWVENTAQRIASSVDRILEDPISFVGKLLTAVKTGFGNFMSNIVEHLEHGFKEFLFGALAEAGITLPETFDLKGIFQLVLSVFGITYEHVKARILQKLGPKAAKVWHLIEEGIAIIKTLAEKGLSGVWDMLMDKVQGIKDLIVDGIKSFVIETVVKKGIEWLLSLFNPAGAFVEAVELIIDVVQFFIQKGKQIQETIDRILDSVESLLNGGEGGVPALIEQSLAKAVPIVITFLADLVGLGDLGTTLQGLVKKAQSITDTAIDWLVDHAIGLVKAAWGALAKGSGDNPDDATAADTAQQRADALLTAPGATPDAVRDALPAIKDDLHLAEISLVKGADADTYHVSVQTAVAQTPDHRLAGANTLDEILSHLTDPPLPALELALNVFSPETHAFVNYPDQSREYVSGGGRHAEWNFDKDIRANLSQWIDPATYPPGSTVPITLKMNRTPCDDCSLVLQGIQTSQIAGRKIALTVLTTSVYGGKKFESKLQEDASAPSKRILVEASKSGLRSLASLRESGVKLGLWDIWDQIGAEMMSSPELQGIDPALVKQNQAQRRNVESWLAGVQQELEKPAQSGK